MTIFLYIIKFSIDISTENLIIYKNIVEETIPSADVICGKTITNLNVKIARVNISGYIYFRVAVNGLQTDELIIDPIITNVTQDPAWTSTDGIVSVKDQNRNNYMTIAYIPIDQEITPMPIKINLINLELGDVSRDSQSDNKTFIIEGTFKLVYMP